MGATCNGTDNNGNLKKQAVFIPSSDTLAQSYDYDSLNRLQWVHETKNGGSTNWQQQYSYDRYGNRTIAQGSTETFGTSIPKPNFTVSTSTNRLGVPYRNGQLLVTITAGAGWGSPPVLHDNPLVVGETTVQARHITELRTAIDALRAREGMAAYPARYTCCQDPSGHEL